MFLPGVPYGEVPRTERPQLVVEFEAACPGCGETVWWRQSQVSSRQPPGEPECAGCLVIEQPEGEE